jgi:hypothetical protein
MSTVGSGNFTLVSLNLPGARLAGSVVQRLVNTDPLLLSLRRLPRFQGVAALVAAYHCLRLALMLQWTVPRTAAPGYSTADHLPELAGTM